VKRLLKESVRLLCPGCKDTDFIDRPNDVPPNTVTIVAYCPQCWTAGRSVSDLKYLDAGGSQIGPDLPLKAIIRDLLPEAPSPPKRKPRPNYPRCIVCRSTARGPSSLYCSERCVHAYHQSQRDEALAVLKWVSPLPPIPPEKVPRDEPPSRRRKARPRSIPTRHHFDFSYDLRGRHAESQMCRCKPVVNLCWEPYTDDPDDGIHWVRLVFHRSLRHPRPRASLHPDVLPMEAPAYVAGLLDCVSQMARHATQYRAGYPNRTWGRFW